MECKYTKVEDLYYRVKKSKDQEVINSYISLLTKYQNIDPEIRLNSIRLLYDHHRELCTKIVKLEKEFKFTIDPFLLSVLVFTDVVTNPKLARTFLLWLWFCDPQESHHTITTFKNTIRKCGIINKKQLLQNFNELELLWKD